MGRNACLDGSLSRRDLAETVQLIAAAVSFGDRGQPGLGVTEAYVKWRPLPNHGWRSQLKLGAFYPGISLENRMSGWRSPYSLTPSAINTWVGEELRTIGAEYALDWLGQKTGHAFDVGVSAAVFGWNDPAGTLIATRGWGLQDQQSTLFGTFGRRDQQPLPERTLFYDDLDKRAGYHVSANLKFRGVLQLTAIHYDNRANPAIYSATLDDTAWKTQFNSAGLRFAPNDQLTLIWQRLYGRTYAGSGPEPNCFAFGSYFTLLSWQQGAARYSVRYDEFTMNQPVSTYGLYDHEQGHAWMESYSRQWRAHWSVSAELLQVDSRMRSRSWVNLPVAARERQLQLALRYSR